MQSIKVKSGWIIFRIDTETEQDGPIDVYLVMDIASGCVLNVCTVVTVLSTEKAHSFLSVACEKAKGKLPSQIVFTKNDPDQAIIEAVCQQLQLTLTLVPAHVISELSREVREFFVAKFSSPSHIQHAPPLPGDDPDEYECAQAMIPDSYALCPCGSSKKYKFCCKRIMVEVTEAMCAVEDGNPEEAIHWLEKAKTKIGETAEIVCREAIVYSLLDMEKSDALLDQCLTLQPTHPRAHYLRALRYKEEGNTKEALRFYEKAAALYPETDHFHLNEVYNNIGVLQFEMGDYKAAKSAWGKALLYLPKDAITQENFNQVKDY